MLRVQVRRLNPPRPPGSLTFSWRPATCGAGASGLCWYPPSVHCREVW